MSRAAVRIGTGYDSHRFAPGGPTILGGVSIPASFHLSGHSDGDALCHAVTDAILGAAAMGDIGSMFPDTDPANAGRDSVEMLRLATAALTRAGWRVVNVDATIIAERPRIAEFRDAMRANVANALGVEAGDVGVKGKTNEGMGAIGRGEGIACIAVALIERATP